MANEYFGFQDAVQDCPTTFEELTKDVIEVKKNKTNDSLKQIIQTGKLYENDPILSISFIIENSKPFISERILIDFITRLATDFSIVFKHIHRLAFGSHNAEFLIWIELLENKNGNISHLMETVIKDINSTYSKLEINVATIIVDKEDELPLPKDFTEVHVSK